MTPAQDNQAITIAKLTDLNFGGVDTGAATYTVNANAGPHSAGTGATAASFTVQGENGQSANVSFGANPVTITDGTTNLSVTLTLDSAQGTTLILVTHDEALTRRCGRQLHLAVGRMM